MERRLLGRSVEQKDGQGTFHHRLRLIMFEKATLPPVCLTILRRRISFRSLPMLEDEVAEASVLCESRHFTEITKELCTVPQPPVEGVPPRYQALSETINSLKCRT